MGGAMPYLIDASNLGGALEGAAGARDAELVVRYLQEWARERGHVVAVFDGAPGARVADRYGPLEVVWSGLGRSADDEIARRAAVEPAQWIVVTNDRELARRCRDLGAAVQSARALSKHVERPHPQSRRGRRASDKPAPSAAEREYWKKVFGGE